METRKEEYGIINKELIQLLEQSREVILITDAYYRTAIDDLNKARANFNAKRAALEQFVGNDVFTQFEKALAERDKKKND